MFEERGFYYFWIFRINFSLFIPVFIYKFCDKHTNYYMILFMT